MQVRIFSLFAVFIAAAVAVGGSGAVTAKERGVAKIDVSTTRGVIHYLRSIHVNPRKVVIQRGLRNYAGAHCPGKGWTCARTRHTVVQIAKRGGKNRFVCKSSKCVVVQISGTSHGVYASGRRLASTAAPNKGGGNSGVCLKNGSGSPTGSGQSCTIIQSGSGPNTAVVWENSQKVAGLTTSLTFTAAITQQATGGSSTQGNTACVTQNINLDGSTTGTKGKPVTVTLEAHQTVNITQNASGTAPNTAANAAVLSGTTAICDPSNAPLGQNQTLTSTAKGTASITQNENASSSGGANVVLDIEQNQGTGFLGVAGGVNNAAFVQTMNQQAIANTPNGPVSQTQSADVPNPPYSGLVGTLNQDSSGISTAHATQSETQCEDAVNLATNPTSCDTDHTDTVPSYSITQKQYGPLGVFTPPSKHSGRVPFAHKGYGQSQQTGNSGDKFFLTQTSQQDNDGGPHSTQANIIVGDCTSGTDLGCQAGQTATLNGIGINDGYTSPTITGLTINCTNGHSTCQATPPPKPEITGTPDDPSESRSATFTWTDDATAGVTFECRIDEGTFDACSSGATFSNLALGSHTFEVRAVDTTPSHNASDPDSFTWTIVPYLTFEATDDGASAGWSGTPGASPISLIVGSDPGTYAQFTLHNFEGIAIGDLPAEPTFTTDTFSGGAPRYEIDLDNGDYLFGYPSNAPYGRSWDVNCGHVGCTAMAQVPWADVTAAEGTAKVTDVLVEADWPPGVSATYNISDFSFDGYNLNFFGNHWH